MDFSQVPEPLNNRCVWLTATVPSAFGDREVPTFVFEILGVPSMAVDGGDRVNMFMPTLFEAGFELTVADDLISIIKSAPHVHSPGVGFDLTKADEGVFHVAAGPLVTAPIGEAYGDPFRRAARASGSVLVLAGIGLNVDLSTGRYELTPAARAGMLAAAYVPAQG